MYYLDTKNICLVFGIMRKELVESVENVMHSVQTFGVMIEG